MMRLSPTTGPQRCFLGIWCFFASCSFAFRCLLTHRPLAALAASPRQVRQIQARIRARLKQNNSQTLQVKDAAVTHNDVFEEFDVYSLKHLPVYIPVWADRRIVPAPWSNNDAAVTHNWPTTMFFRNLMFSCFMFLCFQVFVDCQWCGCHPQLAHNDVF